MTLKKEEKTEEVELPDGSEIGVQNKTRKVPVISSFTMMTKDNVEYRFNSSGQLIYMAEANGNFLLFEHDANKGLLSRDTTSKNLKMEFVYYSEKDYVGEDKTADVLTIKEVILPDGSKVSYEYAHTIQNNSETHDDGEFVNYLLTKVTKTGTDHTSKLNWTLEYNNQKQLIKISDAMEHIYQISYAGDKVEKMTYPNGGAISLVYDEVNHITSTYKEVEEKGKNGDKVSVKILLETNTFESNLHNDLSGNRK